MNMNESELKWNDFFNNKHRSICRNTPQGSPRIKSERHKGRKKQFHFLYPGFFAFKNVNFLVYKVKFRQC